MGKYGLQDCAATTECPIDDEITQIKQRLDAAIDARSSLDFELVELKAATQELKTISTKLIALLRELTGRF